MRSTARSTAASTPALMPMGPIFLEPKSSGHYVYVFGEAEDLNRIHGVGVGSIEGGQTFELRFDGVERAGRFAAGGRVDDDDDVGAIEREGQIEAARAEIFHDHFFRDGASREAADDFDSEGIVAEKNVADSGY